MTEDQQVELLKKWWNKNGNFAIGIFCLAFLVSIGLHYWFKHREIKLARGSAHYERLLSAVVNDDASSAFKEATLLKNNYSHTPYGALAGLILARQDVYQANYKVAETELTWDMKHASTNSLQQVARLRLARVYIQDNQPKLALTILDKVNDKQFMPLIQEVQGDSYVALQNKPKAREFYQKAEASLGNYTGERPLLLMKLNDLAVKS